MSKSGVPGYRMEDEKPALVGPNYSQLLSGVLSEYIHTARVELRVGQGKQEQSQRSGWI